MIVWRGARRQPVAGRCRRKSCCVTLPPVKERAATCGTGGRFSMADTEVVTQQLRIAGYSNVRFERIDAKVMVGRDVDEAVAFQLAIGPAGEVYREAGSEAERNHDRVVAALKEELSQFAAAGKAS